MNKEATLGKIIIIGALPQSLINFRGDLLKALIAAGHEVTAMASETEVDVITALLDMGVFFRPYPIQRNAMNPLRDLQTLLALRKIFYELKPDIVLAYTIKPVVWGGLAAQLSSAPSFYALIEGLGFAFQGGNYHRKIVGFIASSLYKLALRKASRVIFLNPDNRKTFLKQRLIRESKTAIIDSIGLNLDFYRYNEISEKSESVIFLTIARLLGEKGLREYAEAAEIVKQCYPDAEFRLIGQAETSPDAISSDEVSRWKTQASIDYIGEVIDVRPHLIECHIYVLPSYHEGMPRTILEAMAIGRPILTTDVPGCRETVVQGENGYLIPKADAQALAERMIWFIEHPEEWQRMGRCSREMAEKRFDVNKINNELMEIMGLGASEVWSSASLSRKME